MQHMKDLQYKDIQYICLGGLGIRQDVRNGVGRQQSTVAFPEAHRCM